MIVLLLNYYKLLKGIWDYCDFVDYFFVVIVFFIGLEY